MGPELVRSKEKLKLVALFVAAVAVFACREKPAAPAVRKLPQIEATIVTVRTNVSESEKATIHKVVAADGKARIGNELDHWRLFDFTNRTVTRVDEVERSYRTESFDDLFAARRKATARPVPQGVPRARFEVSNEVRTIAGLTAQRHSVRLGEYRRDLWISREPLIDPMLFAIASASEAMEAEYGGVMRDVYPRIVALRGFPLIDRSEIAAGKQTVIAERIVEKIERGPIPAAWLQIPTAYENKTPKAPDANRQNGASRRSGRDARGAERRSSSTTRSTP